MVGGRRDQPPVVLGERGRGGMPDHDQYPDDFRAGGQRDDGRGALTVQQRGAPSADSSAPGRARAVSTSSKVRPSSAGDEDGCARLEEPVHEQVDRQEERCGHRPRRPWGALAVLRFQQLQIERARRTMRAMAARLPPSADAAVRLARTKALGQVGLERTTDG